MDIEPYIEQLEQGHGGKEEELCLPLQDPKGKIRKGPANLGKVYVRIGIGYAKDFFAAKLLADREVLGRVSLEIQGAPGPGPRRPGICHCRAEPPYNNRKYKGPRGCSGLPRLPRGVESPRRN